MRHLWRQHTRLLIHTQGDDTPHRVDVRPCKPFSISLATSNGSNSHTNVCSHRGLLPLPLINGTSYYQTCFINPYASETFISPQAIIDSSTGSFDKWQMEGFSQGRPGVLSLYSPSGILKMSIQLTQQDGLYYSPTDTFTVDTNPRSRSPPFVGIAFTDLPPGTHLIDDYDDTTCSTGSDDDSVSVVPNFIDTPTTVSAPHSAAPAHITPIDTPVDHSPYVAHSAPPCSRVTVRPTNLARQLESELWAARMGHCGEDQLNSPALTVYQTVSYSTHFVTLTGKNKPVYVNVLHSVLHRRYTTLAHVSTWILGLSVLRPSTTAALTSPAIA